MKSSIFAGALVAGILSLSGCSHSEVVEADTVQTPDVAPDVAPTPDVDVTADVEPTPDVDVTADVEPTPDVEATPDTDVEPTPDVDTTPDPDTTDEGEDTATDVA